MNIKFSLLFLLPIIIFHIAVQADDNEDLKTDILFLKIQELETEIAELRDRVESQNYLIEKLINESLEVSQNKSSNIDNLNLGSDIKFKGIEDPKSEDQIYNGAITALENQEYDRAYNLFNYFVSNFDNVEKKPLAYFWLGEISFINDDLENANKFYLELINSFPNHYRVPLSHKKIGDIYMKKGQTNMASNKYNFVIRQYPNNTASSLALQILKNME